MWSSSLQASCVYSLNVAVHNDDANKFVKKLTLYTLHRRPVVSLRFFLAAVPEEIGKNRTFHVAMRVRCNCNCNWQCSEAELFTGARPRCGETWRTTAFRHRRKSPFTGQSFTPSTVPSKVQVGSFEFSAQFSRRVWNLSNVYQKQLSHGLSSSPPIFLHQTLVQIPRSVSTVALGMHCHAGGDCTATNACSGELSGKVSCYGALMRHEWL